MDLASTTALSDDFKLISELDKIKKLSIPTPSFSEIHNCLLQTLREFGTTSTPACKHIVGHSRTGKSFAVREFEAKFPPVRTTAGLKKEVIYVQAPVQGTIKGVMEALLEALGDPHWMVGSYSSMLARLLQLLRQVGCKMIILDEFQHLADKGQRAILKRTTDWLKVLVERNSFSLVCVGLPASLRIIRSTEQLRTRFDATIEVPVYDWTNEQSRKVFRSVVHSIQKDMFPFEVPDLGSEQLSLRMFIACAGRIGLLSKILDRAVKSAIWENRTAIRLEHLDSAFRNAIWFAEEIPVPGGPFFGALSLDSAPELYKQAMLLAEHVPAEEEDKKTHLGSMQSVGGKKQSRKKIKNELTRIFG
ncbi:MULTISPECIES: TniB family NTP-binding protein [Xanthomonas]|uniref:TniB family NTP-binding protein n=1 Tax=Xanthomonas TaxID=338 RepID=UPI001ADA82BC|nr:MULTISPECIES: TniB family NTP-binding protein [unclassified Xanthomonas]MBO9873521.1 TniB family NTP-binding protein [Xanthomonas sp. D-93]WNH45302.1 TniB family NTP-binding protein [Xanthomonas sp. A6251]